MTPLHFVIIGAGFAGTTCARVLADAGHRITLLDRRPHVGGNAYDCHDAHGVRIHPYGPHIFHTASRRVFEFLSRFTCWRFYEHRVRAVVDGQCYPLPINRTTLNRLYGLSLDEDGAKRYFEAHRLPRDRVTTSEDVVLNSIGRDLCDKFFRGYTRKQWGLDLSELSAGVAARIPTRTNDDDRYFTDAYQFMPAEGYTAMFQRMLDHPRIDLQLSADHAELPADFGHDHLVYTGPIDAYYRYRHGPLPYRSLEFQHEHLPDCRTFQETGTINYPNDHAYTRITEFKHLTGQSHRGTSIVREIPKAEGEPYYPIPRIANEALYKRYQQMTDTTPDVTFVGRLAQYRYYNMDQVVAAAQTACKRWLSA